MLSSYLSWEMAKTGGTLSAMVRNIVYYIDKKYESHYIMLIGV
jgi:hypothetical protein